MVFNQTLTAKGRETRARIVEAAATLIHDKGVAATTLEDIKAAAGVSSSQLYHYFADKQQLVEAVIEHQAQLVVSVQQGADLSTPEGLRAWQTMVVSTAAQTGGRGGCPLGSLGGQLAETDEDARTQISEGFESWSEALRDGVDVLAAAGRLQPGLTSDALATTLLAVIQGGLLLGQVQRDTAALQAGLDTILTLAVVA